MSEAVGFRQIGASPASVVVTTGDNVYNSGTETEYGDLSRGNVFPSGYLHTYLSGAANLGRRALLLPGRAARPGCRGSW